MNRTAKKTGEEAFEEYLAQILQKGGWRAGDNAQWDDALALFPARITAFLRATQPQLWRRMEQSHGEALPQTLIEALAKELNIKGTLDVLRHGFRFYGKTFRLAYFKPAHGLNEETRALYDKNELCVTRQALCHPGKNAAVDMLLSLNGLPVATCELKNPGTGQRWSHAVKQYRNDRDPAAPLFKFKTRALVHFAADTDEVHMATRLEKGNTHFLPFNRGSHPGEIQCGAGNPAHSSGYGSGYFWEEVLRRDSFLDILCHFMFIEKSEEKTADGDGGQRLMPKEKLIFPRYHQLDAVRKIVAAARGEGAGHNYLIQHSAGSGKTNSISWLAHRLAVLHDAGDRKIFDCVIVISDRRVLDRQLQDAIYQIQHAQGVVKAIDRDSKQLAEALVDGTKIVIATLQKFPFVLKALLNIAGGPDAGADAAATKQARQWQAQIAGRKYAVVVDEAHSSQTGEAARELKEILGVGAFDDEEDGDWEDRLNQVMQSRGRQPNLSFFAFTATPKGKTIELFGRPAGDGAPEAFHSYSMRQAIEEGFILDVLRNYTIYETFFGLVKLAADDPRFPEKKAARALAKFAFLHPHNIEQKTEVIVEHFMRTVRHKLRGRAKAMVVTSSRLHAVRYKLAFDRYIAEKNYGIHSLVAFSGTVTDPKSGKKYTEPGMNRDVASGEPVSESRLPQRFDSGDYQILLVANKYQTGFDQPRLQAMYVDKRLDGVQAVQTLSRLNRMLPGKEEPFVLDFVNRAEDVYRAFKPYYDTTGLAQTSDYAALTRLKHELDQAQVYHQAEVQQFRAVYYRKPENQKPSDHAEMVGLVAPAVGRFNALATSEDKEEFRAKLGACIRLYAFLSQILPFSDEEMEALYSYGRWLIRHLPAADNAAVKLVDDVALHFYRLNQVYSGAIPLDRGEPSYVKPPAEVGTGAVMDEVSPLSEIIDALNQRFGTDFTEEDRLFFVQIKERACKNEDIIAIARANELDLFKVGIRQIINNLMMERHSENDRIVSNYIDNKSFQETAFPILARAIYRAVRVEGKDGHNELSGVVVND